MEIVTGTISLGWLVERNYEFFSGNEMYMGIGARGLTIALLVVRTFSEYSKE